MARHNASSGLVRRVIVLVAASGAAPLCLATGPIQQTMPWQGGGTTRDSIVQINVGGSFSGTGSVIRKTVGSDGNLWLGLVTADHVTRPGGVNSVVGSGHSIRFGDNAAQGEFGRVGGVGESWYRQFPGADLAFLAINMGPANGANQPFVNNVREIAYIPVALDQNNLPNENGTRFTQYGYGDTGPYAAAGGGNPAGISNTGATGHKRFQNNAVTGVGVDVGIYAGTPVLEWRFDQPAAAGFLKAEGTAFSGDSGGPYMTQDHTFYNDVAAFTRSGATNPDGGGVLGILRNSIFAVHNGSSPIVGVGGAAAYNRLSWGTPLMPAYVDWLNGQSLAIPTPGTAALLGMAGLLAARRRRA